MDIQLGKYKHFKGNEYQILTVAEHSEDGSQMVVYKALYGEEKCYVRPLDMFLEDMDDVYLQKAIPR